MALPDEFTKLLKKNEATFDSNMAENEILIAGLTLTTTEMSLLKIRFDGWSTRFIQKLKLLGIDGLIDDYKRLVMSCRDEKSYYGKYKEEGSSEKWASGPGISYEYGNYISCRTALQIIFECVSGQKSRSIKARIDEYDKILRGLIDKNNRTFYENKNKKYPEEIYWWYYKLPVNVNE